MTITNTDSILQSIKKLLNIEHDFTHFDQDITLQINTALMTVNQLGVGPAEGYRINGSENKWSELLTDSLMYDAVKTLVYLQVRLAFDPPTNSFLVEAVKNQIEELQWRLRSQAELIKKEAINE